MEMLPTTASNLQEKGASSITVKNMKATLDPVTNIVALEVFYKFLEICGFRNFSILSEYRSKYRLLQNILMI